MVSIDEGREALATATATLETATAEFEEHVKRNRMAEALSAADAIRAANVAVTKARDTVTRLEYESKSAEREAASVVLKASLDALIASEVWTAARDLGVNGFTVVLNGEGALNIAIRTIHEKAPAGAKRGPKPGGEGTGGTKGRLVFIVEGNEYTSRALLDTFGAAQMGQEWLDKVFERQAAGGGFDAPVKALAAKLEAKVMKRIEGELVEVS